MKTVGRFATDVASEERAAFIATSMKLNETALLVPDDVVMTTSEPGQPWEDWTDVT